LFGRILSFGIGFKISVFGFALRIWIRFRIWISAFSSILRIRFSVSVSDFGLCFLLGLRQLVGNFFVLSISLGFKILASTDFGFDFSDFVISSIIFNFKVWANTIKKTQEQNNLKEQEAKKNK
jgi:hypothetical protein